MPKLQLSKVYFIFCLRLVMDFTLKVTLYTPPHTQTHLPVSIQSGPLNHSTFKNILISNCFERMTSQKIIMELDIICNSTINVQGKLVPQGDFFLTSILIVAVFKAASSHLCNSVKSLDTDSVSNNGCIDIYCSSYSLTLKDASSFFFSQ